MDGPINVWYVDGVSCLGKTSFVERHGGRKMDYADRSRKQPAFISKANDHVVQIAYTASFCLETLAARAGRVTCDRCDPCEDALPLYVDRSPISDIWYEMLFKHYDDAEARERALQLIEQLDVFAMAPTVFVVPRPEQAGDVVRHMGLRNNGIDRCDETYVLQQIDVFEQVARRFEQHPRVRTIRTPLDVLIYSPEYFDFIHDRILALTK